MAWLWMSQRLLGCGPGSLWTGGNIIEKWLDHKSIEFISDLIHLWGHKKWAVRRCRLLRGSRFLGMCLWRVLPVFWLPWNVQVPLPWASATIMFFPPMPQEDQNQCLFSGILWQSRKWANLEPFIQDYARGLWESLHKKQMMFLSQREF